MTRLITLLALAAGAIAARADDASTAEFTITLSLPAEQHAGCFADSMRLPRDLVARLPERAVATFTIDQTGAVRGVRVDGQGSGALATQVKGGLSRCAWTPAADSAGRPVSMTVRLPIRFETAAEAVAIVVRAWPGPMLAAR